MTEIPVGPQLGDTSAAIVSAAVAIAVLAAGQSSRTKGSNKLLATFDGMPLIRRSTITALQAGGNPVITVLGHMALQCSKALDGLDIVVAHNEAYASGLASSLQCAVRHVPTFADGAMIVLADMPALSVEHLRRLITAFQTAGARSVVRATFDGKRGNPVILPRLMFDEVFTLSGDVGARNLIDRGGVPVIDIELGEAAALDVDTCEAVLRAGGTLP